MCSSATLAQGSRELKMNPLTLILFVLFAVYARGKPSTLRTYLEANFIQHQHGQTQARRNNIGLQPHLNNAQSWGHEILFDTKR